MSVVTGLFKVFGMKKIFLLIITGAFISIVISCLPTEHYIITGIRFFGVELTNPEETDNDKKVYTEVTDVIKNRLIFQVWADTEYRYGYLKNSSFISNANASSQPELIDNFIFVDSIELKLNSDIYFKGDTIPANTNLWKYPALSEFRWSHKTEKYNSNLYYFTFGFTDSFYSFDSIPKKDYVIELTCRTSDDRIFVKTTELFIDL